MIETTNIIEAPKKIDITHNRQISRGIQFTPKTRLGLIARRKRRRQINKEINVLQEKVFELEGKKEKFSKNVYMVEYGEIERIQKKIDRIEEKITILIEEHDLINSRKLVNGKKKKPLRLLPSMFREARKSSMVAAKYRGKDLSSDPITEVKASVDKHLIPVNQSLQDDFRGSIDAERLEITDTINRYQDAVNQTLRETMRGTPSANGLDEVSEVVEQHLKENEQHFQNELEKMGVTSQEEISERIQPLPKYESNIKGAESYITHDGAQGENERYFQGEVSKMEETSSNDISPISFDPNFATESSMTSSTDAVDSVDHFLENYHAMQQKARLQSQSNAKAVEKYNNLRQMNDDYIKMRNKYIEEIVNKTSDLQKQINQAVVDEAKQQQMSEEMERNNSDIVAEINALKAALEVSNVDEPEKGRRI